MYFGYIETFNRLFAPLPSLPLDLPVPLGDANIVYAPWVMKNPFFLMKSTLKTENLKKRKKTNYFKVLNKRGKH